MKCPRCPYYEQNTSYGTETIKCNNKDCEHSVVELQESEGEE